jgi:hypothetical protein
MSITLALPGELAYRTQRSIRGENSSRTTIPLLTSDFLETFPEIRRHLFSSSDQGAEDATDVITWPDR